MSIGFVIGWLSAAVTLLTVLPMLQDALGVPSRRDPSTLVRHYLRLAVLVAVAAFSGVLIFYPGLLTASIYEIALRASLACYLVQQTPHPWWRYVFQDAYRKSLLSNSPKVRAP